jgi:hypothetical protein
MSSLIASHVTDGKVDRIKYRQRLAMKIELVADLRQPHGRRW